MASRQSKMEYQLIIFLRVKMNAHYIILIMLLVVLGFSIAAVMHKKKAESYYVVAPKKRPQVVATTQSQAQKCATRRAECNSKSGSALANCRTAMSALGC